MPRSLKVLALALAAFALPAAGAPAATYNVAVGIGDQHANMFTEPNFKALKIKKARYFIRWNSIKNRGELALADAYVAEARRNGVRVLMHISTNDLRAKRAKLPSVAQYKRDVGRLVRRYKAKGVKEWGVWNEANHKTQPTYKSPKRAAEFFMAMRSMCTGCTILGLDILDQAGADRYINSFYKALGKKRRSLVRYVGIHNYSDTNRNRDRGTRKILSTVKKHNRRTQFWLTETGGVVNFGRAFPCNEARAAKAVKFMFTLTKRFRRDIKRLYSYNYFGTTPSCAGFDAGLVDSNGTPRAGYHVFASEARSFAR